MEMPKDLLPGKCGKFAAPWIPRRGEYFSCVLLSGHKGECRPGGTCVVHGEYSSEPGKPPRCPKCPADYTINTPKALTETDFLAMMDKLYGGREVEGSEPVPVLGQEGVLQRPRHPYSFPYDEGSPCRIVEALNKFFGRVPDV